jgi:alcohol dehydrogenase YqhD (iron-dependent ADH family)
MAELRLLGEGVAQKWQPYSLSHSILNLRLLHAHGLADLQNNYMHKFKTNNIDYLM